MVIILDFQNTSVPLSLQIIWAGYEFKKNGDKNRINNLHYEILDLFDCAILTEKERDRAFERLYDLIEKCVKPIEVEE